MTIPYWTGSVLCQIFRSCELLVSVLRSGSQKFLYVSSTFCYAVNTKYASTRKYNDAESQYDASARNEHLDYKGVVSVFFALKILRFLFGLVLKAILLPFRLTLRLVRGRTDDGHEYYDNIDEQPVAGEESTAGATGERSSEETEVRADASPRAEPDLAGEATSSNTASYSIVDTKREEFRNAIAIFGAFGVVGAAMLYNDVPVILSGEYAVRFQSAILAPVLITGAVWAGLNRRSEVAWAAGVLWPALAIVFRFEPDIAPWYLESHHWGVLYLFGQVMGFQDLLFVAICGAFVVQGLRTRPSTWLDPSDRAEVGGEATGGHAAAPTEQTPSARSSDAVNDDSEPSGKAPDSVAKQETTSSGTGTDTTSAAAATSDSSADGTFDPETGRGDRASPGGGPPGTKRQVASATGDGATEMTGDEAGSTASRDGSGQESDQANDAPPAAEYSTGIDADDPSARRQAVRRVTGAVENDVLSPSAAVDILRTAVRDDDPAVRVAVCEALGAAGTEAAKDELDRLRLDPDSDVSRAATRANRHFE